MSSRLLMAALAAGLLVSSCRPATTLDASVPDAGAALNVQTRSAIVTVRRSLQLVATAIGGVTWTLASGGGSLTEAGFYTAPDLPGNAVAAVTSNADPSAKATVAIEIVAEPPVPEVALPAKVTAGVGGYRAEVKPSAGLAYVWSIEGGMITAGATSTGMTFAVTAPAGGRVRVECRAVNAAGDAAPGFATADVLAAPIATIRELPATGLISSGRSATARIDELPSSSHAV